LVETKTNLADWASTRTATQVPAGLVQCTDTTAANYLRRFYELQSP